MFRLICKQNFEKCIHFNGFHMNYVNIMCEMFVKWKRFSNQNNHSIIVCVDCGLNSFDCHLNWSKMNNPLKGKLIIHILVDSMSGWLMFVWIDRNNGKTVAPVDKQQSNEVRVSEVWLSLVLTIACKHSYCLRF